MSIQACCPPGESLRLDYDYQAALFKALGDPHRAAILAALARAESEICVCDFVEGLPLNQPAVSHHLKILKETGLIRGERRGTWVYYALAPGARERLEAALEYVFPHRVLEETEERDGAACCSA